MSPRLQTALLFILVSWIWGSTWLAIRLGLQGVPPVTAVAMRMSASGAILILLALALRQTWPRSRVYWLHLAIQGSILFCFQYALIYWAEQTVPSGLAAVLFATLPIFTALNAGYVFKIERLLPVNVAGLIVGFLGVVLIYWSEVIYAAHAPPLGVMALIVAVIPVASALVFAKRYAHDIPPLATVGPGQLVGGTLLWIIALVVERGKPIHFTAVSAGSLIYLIVFGSCIVFLAYFTLLKRMSVTRLSVLTYITPVVAVMLGALVAREVFAPTTLAGAALVLAGVSLVNRH
jgi:drug/metabolite transporter (DMT)-like permease